MPGSRREALVTIAPSKPGVRKGGSPQGDSPPQDRRRRAPTSATAGGARAAEEGAEPERPRGRQPAAIGKDVAVAVGERIRSRRLELGLTQSELAGPRMTKALISQIELGRTRPSDSTLDQILARLDLRREDILGSSSRERAGRGQPAPLVDRAQAADVAPSSLRGAAMLRTASAYVAAEVVDGAAQDLERSKEFVTGADRAVHHRLEAEVALASGDLQLALEHGLQACRLNEPISGEAALAQLVVGRVHYAYGRLPAALRYFEAASDAATAARAPAIVRARIHTNCGVTHMVLGDTASAMNEYENARLAAAEAEDLRQVALAHMGIGTAARDQGDYAVAIAHAERAVELFERLELRQLQAQNLHNVAEAYADMGDAKKARRLQEQALDAARALKDRVTSAHALEKLAELDLSEGQPLAAIRHVQEAVALAREAGERTLTAIAHATFGDACEALADHVAADAAYADAITAAVEAGGYALRTVRLRRGALLRRRGDYLAAAAEFEAAARCGPSLGPPLR